MKSILFINYEYPPVGGGGANANFYFATNIAAKEIKCSVLTSAYKTLHGLQKENGISVYRIPSLRRRAERSSILQMSLYVFSALLKIKSVIKKERPEVLVVFFGLPCGPVGLFVRLIWKIPYVVMLRGGDVPGVDNKVTIMHKILTPLRRIIYKNSAAVIANSEGLQNSAATADKGFSIDIVRNGVDTVFFHPSDKNSIPPDNFTFLFAGRFSEQKNLSLLLKAFSQCLNNHPSIRLILIGDGPTQKKLRLYASTLGIEKQIEWPGWCSKETLRSYYQSCNCFINPSHYEGMPNAVLEAMACGLPIIASCCIGNNEVIKDTVTGFLFDSNDDSRLTETMAYMIQNRQLCKKLGNNGRELCCRKYSWQAASNELCSLIESRVGIINSPFS